MKHTSKPYSTGYYSYAKNYVKSFGIYPFSEEQKKHLLSLKSKTEVDNYVKAVYGLAIWKSCILTLYNITDEEKQLITDFSEANNMSISELILKIIEDLEDEEDYKLAEKIINNPNTKYTEGMEDLAKECGIDYDAL